MSLTVTIDLPDEVASRFIALPEEERSQFSVDAITEALLLREEEQADCVTVVEQALADMDAGIGLISFEDVCRQWNAEKEVAEQARQQRIAQIAAESLRRMQNFPNREEQFIAAIRKSKS